MSALNAQPKTADAVRSAVTSAEADAANVKKNTKVATWLKLAESYMNAYNFAQGTGWLGASRQELQLVAGEKPQSTEDVMLQNQAYHKEVYATHNYYFNANGILAIIEVTAPLYEDPLAKAVIAYREASKVDAKGQKTKDILNGIEAAAAHYLDDAYTDYNFLRYAQASDKFEKAALTVAEAPISRIDTGSIYNAAYLAFLDGNLERSKVMFEQCLGYGYYGEGGEVYAKLADIAEKAGDKNTCRNYLEEAFSKFPESQSILVGLINFYLTSGEEPTKLFELLNQAKRNEPGNASLYYVEGNVHSQLGNYASAEESYNKCAEINPNYEWGYVGAGLMFYNLAVKIQEQANDELDYKKWAELDKKFTEALKSCITPFEKGFEITADKEVKLSVAEYLKSACYRFRDEDASYAEKYDKYYKYVTENK